jgi:lipopolysaccharide biosynthesis glycosyltransferase
MILNFLYAFDKNYTRQGCVSIYSLLEQVDRKINIFVILDETNKSFEFPENIKSHRNLKQITVKIIDTNNEFYNVEQSHISKATFYRLYISSLFKNEDKKLIYLDADIVCVANPIKEISSAISKLEFENKCLAFADEFYRYQNEEPFLRLEMSGTSYFNAGVMIVDSQRWRENEYSKKSIYLIEKLKNKAQFWDQDILNSLVDGNYLTLNSILNYRTSGISTNKFVDDIIFIHFSGKSKPWDVGGIFEEYSLIYHSIFEQLFNKKFHIVSTNRKNSIKKLFNYSKFFHRVQVNDLLIYIVHSIYAIIKKNNSI